MRKYGGGAGVAEGDREGISELEWRRVDHTELVADGVSECDCLVDISPRMALDAHNLYRAACDGLFNEAAQLCVLQRVL